MSTKYSFRSNGSKVAATVLSAVSFVMLIGALSLFFTADFHVFWLPIPLVLLFIAAFVLTLCAIFGNPKLITAAAVLTAVSQIYLLFLVISRAVDCVIFRDLPEWTQIVIPSVLSGLFVAFYIAFAVVSAKNTKSKSLTKSVKGLFVVLLIVIALVCGFDIASAALGHYSVKSVETYYGDTVSASALFFENHDDCDNYFSWRDDNNVGHYAGYDNAGWTELTSSASVSAESRRRTALAQIDSSVSLNDCFVVNTYALSSSTFSDLQVVPSYILSEYSLSSISTQYSYQLYKLVGHYQDGSYTARQMFEMYNKVNLSRTDRYKVVPSTYPYFGFAKEVDLNNKLSSRSLTIAEVSIGYRIPDVFFIASAVCGAVALYLISAHCEIVEEEVDKKAVKVVGNGSTAPLPKTLLRQNIALNVFLTIVTCGIYGFVWFYRTARNVRILSGENTVGIGDETALYVIGGSFYGMYWYYSRAKRLGETLGDVYAKCGCLSSTVYLLADIFSFGLLPLCLMTRDINNVIDELNGESKLKEKPSAEQLSFMNKRLGLVETILLSIVTFGIYYIITLARVVNRVNALQGNKQASVGQLVCLFLVPFYWIYWLATYAEKLDEEGNRTTLECWLVNLIPFYGVYWLLTRSKDIETAAADYSVPYYNSAVLAVLSVCMPALGFCITLTTVDRVSDNLDAK